MVLPASFVTPLRIEIDLRCGTREVINLSLGEGSNGRGPRYLNDALIISLLLYQLLGGKVKQRLGQKRKKRVGL